MGARIRLGAVLVSVLSLVIAFGPSAKAVPSLGRTPLGPAVRPVKGIVPSWYTHALHQQVVAAGSRGVTGAALPFDTTQVAAVGLASSGIRPGQWLFIDDGAGGLSLCSANFVFIGGATGRGLGTAGHCGVAGNTVIAYVFPPGGLPGLYSIGTIVLSTGDGGIGNDFAMVGLTPQAAGWANPAMPVWGRPTGTYDGVGTEFVVHFGHGAAIGTGGTPRAGLGVLDAGVPGGYAFLGAATKGDSGSGVMTLGRLAVGNYTHFSVVLPVLQFGTRISRMLALAPGWSLA